MASTSHDRNGFNADRKTDTNKRESVLELSDVTCPICMDIRIEPVTMPCDHELCLGCFEQHVQKASLRCPLCRRYISNWARQASRNGSLVNQKRWRAIQQYFPERVHRRLNSLDDEIDVGKPTGSRDGEEEGCPRPLISDQGEIRKEFELQMNKMIEEEEKQRQIENTKSERLIRMLTQMDERDAQKKRLQGLRLTQDDSAIARALSDEINETSSSADPYVLDSEFLDVCGHTPRPESLPLLSALPSKSRKRGRPFLRTGFAAPPGAARTTRAASQSVHSGSAAAFGGGLRDSATPPFRRTSSSSSLPLCLEKFNVDGPSFVDLCGDDESCLGGGGEGGLRCPPLDVANDCAPSVESEEDSISGELCHFTPIKVEPKTPPMRSPDGRLFEPALIHTKPRNLSGDMEEPRAVVAPALQQRIARVQEQRASALEAVPSVGEPSGVVSGRQVVFPLTPTNVTLKGLANQKGRNAEPYPPALRNVPPCVVVDAANKENPIGKSATFDKPTAKRKRPRKGESPSDTTTTTTKRRDPVQTSPADVPPSTTTRGRRSTRAKTKPVGRPRKVAGAPKVPPTANLTVEPNVAGKRLAETCERRPRGVATVTSSAAVHTTRRLSTKQQLESDRLLALRLSREWEREARLVDRRAGTDGQYLLRQRHAV